MPELGAGWEDPGRTEANMSAARQAVIQASCQQVRRASLLSISDGIIDFGASILPFWLRSAIQGHI